LTFRNKFYSPVGGPNTDPGAAGIQDGQVISLVATDGTTVSAPRSFMAFIDNDGADALSGGVLPDEDYRIDLSTTQGTWVQNPLFVGDGGSVSLSWGINGLCADASAQGTNLSGWASSSNFTGTAATAYHTVTLADNAVYRIRISATTTAQAGFTPLWYVMAENSLSWYGMSNYFYDSGTFPAPGLNTPPGTGGGTRPTFESWFQPASSQSASFKTAAFNTPANTPFKDFRLQLQILDVGTTAADPYGGASDQGAVCWNKVEVDRFEFADIQVQSTPYNNTAPRRVTGTDTTDPDNVTINDFTAAGQSTVTASTTTGGPITFAPTSATAWDGQAGGTNAFMAIYPGDATNAHTGGADAVDNYPVPWVADQLYRIAYTLAAPNALAETNGVDWIIIGGDVDTNEIITGNFVTTKFSSSAMPKQAAQEYYAYWHGQNGTIVAGFQRMRPYLFTGTNNDFVDTPNQAGIRVDAIRVDIVSP
jgi:hypothetical protein